MRHLFFAEREAAKVLALENIEASTINAVGVIVSGTMDVGISLALISAGIEVMRVYTNADELARGRGKILSKLEANIPSARISGGCPYRKWQTTNFTGFECA